MVGANSAHDIDANARSSRRRRWVYSAGEYHLIHPFREARLSVWAPEEDTSDYYGRFLPLDAGAVPLAPTASG
jgi:hypothetical protein